MSTGYATIFNHHERAVFAAIAGQAPAYPHLNDDETLGDIACVALNRLPPRYIRHAVDMAFYQSEKERADSERAIADAVTYAYEFVQARVAMRAR